MALLSQKITPFLWFDNNAEQAVNFYVSTFRDSRILHLQRHAEGGPGPVGSLFVARFEIEGQPFSALNGGPAFNFTEAVSFVVGCDSQIEVDHLWDRLGEGGSPGRCGWLKDRFGLSWWQIVPSEFFDLIRDPDPAASARVMAAMMQMTKFDIAALRSAHRG
jgi:predicted 3-demethylubiquinone-9 3-methyltransferase (glyoxalase superfamily)